MKYQDIVIKNLSRQSIATQIEHIRTTCYPALKKAVIEGQEEEAINLLTTLKTSYISLFLNDGDLLSKSLNNMCLELAALLLDYVHSSVQEIHIDSNSKFSTQLKDRSIHVHFKKEVFSKLIYRGIKLAIPHETRFLNEPLSPDQDYDILEPKEHTQYIVTHLKNEKLKGGTESSREELLILEQYYLLYVNMIMESLPSSYIANANIPYSNLSNANSILGICLPSFLNLHNKIEPRFRFDDETITPLCYNYQSRHLNLKTVEEFEYESLTLMLRLLQGKVYNSLEEYVNIIQEDAFCSLEEYSVLAVVLKDFGHYSIYADFIKNTPNFIEDFYNLVISYDCSYFPKSLIDLYITQFKDRLRNMQVSQEDITYLKNILCSQNPQLGAAISEPLKEALSINPLLKENLILIALFYSVTINISRIKEKYGAISNPSENFIHLFKKTIYSTAGLNSDLLDQPYTSIIESDNKLLTNLYTNISTIASLPSRSELKKYEKTILEWNENLKYPPIKTFLIFPEASLYLLSIFIKHNIFLTASAEEREFIKDILEYTDPNILSLSSKDESMLYHLNVAMVLHLLVDQANLDNSLKDMIQPHLKKLDAYILKEKPSKSEISLLLDKPVRTLSTPECLQNLYPLYKLSIFYSRLLACRKSPSYAPIYETIWKKRKNHLSWIFIIHNPNACTLKESYLWIKERVKWEGCSTSRNKFIALALNAGFVPHLFMDDQQFNILVPINPTAPIPNQGAFALAYSNLIKGGIIPPIEQKIIHRCFKWVRNFLNASASSSFGILGVLPTELCFKILLFTVGEEGKCVQRDYHSLLPTDPQNFYFDPKNYIPLGLINDAIYQVCDNESEGYNMITTLIDDKQKKLERY